MGTTGRAFLPFSDVEGSVRDDAETLKNSEYYVRTGELQEVVRS